MYKILNYNKLRILNIILTFFVRINFDILAYINKMIELIELKVLKFFELGISG